jgi:hypothetical protein
MNNYHTEKEEYKMVWAVTSFISERARRFHLQGEEHLAELPPASAAFLLSLLIDLEDGGDIFRRTVRTTPNYTALKPTKPHFSYHRYENSKSKERQEVCWYKVKSKIVFINCLLNILKRMCSHFKRKWVILIIFCAN